LTLDASAEPDATSIENATPPATPGVERTSILRNVVWNWGGMGVELCAGLVIAPYLVSRLGDATYGLWIFIGSLTGYFGLLDLGVRGSVGRHVALYRAQRNVAALNATLSSGTAVLGAMACVVLLAAGAIGVWLPHLAAASASEARTVLALSAAGLAAALVLNLFDATLWGYQRFDLLNKIDIVGVIFRVGATVAVVESGFGIVGLATVMLALTLLTGLVKAFTTFRVAPELRLAQRFVQRAMIRTLFGYASWNFARSMGRMARTTVGPLAIGTLLGMSMLTPFSIAARLVAYEALVIVAATGVLVPVSTALHAEASQRRQRKLLLEGGKHCFGLAVFFTVLFLLLGQPLLGLWMGVRFESAWQLLAILAMGEFLPVSQQMTEAVLFGTARHQILAVLSGIECVLVLALAWILMPTWQLTGACLALALPAAFCRGLVPLVFSCRCLKVSLGEYIRRAVLPPLAVGLLPTVCLWLLVRTWPADTWMKLTACTAVFAMIFGLLWSRVFEDGWVPSKLRDLLAQR
jgi:O-antigen/teichoic acid export membrane protein